MLPPLEVPGALLPPEEDTAFLCRTAPPALGDLPTAPLDRPAPTLVDDGDF